MAIAPTSSVHQLVIEGLQSRIERRLISVNDAKAEARRLEVPEGLIGQLSETVGAVPYGTQSQVVARPNAVPATSAARGSAAIHAAVPAKGELAIRTIALDDLSDHRISGFLQQTAREAAHELKSKGLLKITVLGIYTMGSEISDCLDAVRRHERELVALARDGRGTRVGVFAGGVTENLEGARSLAKQMGRTQLPAVEIDVSGAEAVLRFAVV